MFLSGSNNSKTGILSYGVYIPYYRISAKEIAKAHGANVDRIEKGLGIISKSVPGLDEDSISMAVEATWQMVHRYQGNLDVGAIYAGSESHPYTVKPTAGIVGDTLGIENTYTSADVEFACKAGSASKQMGYGLVESGRIRQAIAIASDTAQGAPGDALEYSAAAGAVSFLLGTGDEVIAKLLYTSSLTTDTPDFWRRPHQQFPKHAGRFSGDPGYFYHVETSTRNILKSTGYKMEDFTHVVFHMPNGKFPKSSAKKLGVTRAQMAQGFVVPHIGNTYSASALIGFAKVLDVLNPGEKVLLVTYGSGSGSDAFIYEGTHALYDYRKNSQNTRYAKTVEHFMKTAEFLSYGAYVRHTNKLKGGA